MLFFYFYFGFLFFSSCSGDGDVTVYRPCPDLDPDCIRDYFAFFGNCFPIYSRPEILYFDQLVLPIPHANSTFYWANAEMTGIDSWEITEFYIDNESNDIVIEVEFDEIILNSSRSYNKYYLKARKPTVLADYFQFTYLKTYVTATIPYDPVEGYLWSRVDGFAWFPIGTGSYIAGPGLVNSDPEVQACAAEMFANLDLGLKEVANIVGTFFFNSFLQNYFCKV